MNARPSRPRLSFRKRIAFIAVLALGPLGTACELFLDFDRSPLQPQYEAGAEEDDSGGGTTPRRDATTDRGGNPPPQDAGNDGSSTTADADAQGG
jgi:hypothetical protein